MKPPDAAVSGRRSPRHNPGRYVTFVSTCDLAGGNADGNYEIFQWNRQTNVIQQITTTGPTVLNDGTSSSDDGRYVAFISEGDLAGQNSDGNLEVFRWDRNGGGSFLQVTDTSGFVVHTAAAIESTGRYLAVERLDALTVTFTMLAADAATGALTAIASGDPSLPSVSLSSGSPLVSFQATGNYTANNADGNSEIWRSTQALAPPDSFLHCSSPGAAIPDNDPGGVSDTLTIADTLTLQDLDVQIAITHTYVGDLVATLVHVDTGTSVVLVDRPGSPPGFGCSGDDIDATLDDDAAAAVEAQCVTPGPVAIEGRYVPNDALSSFAGEDLTGDWTLTVQDSAGGDVGTLVEWCLVSEG
jgi:hypothetical protein